MEVEGLAQVKIGNREGDVFRDCGSQLPAASGFVSVRRPDHRRGLAVILDHQHTEGFLMSDKRD